MRIGAAVSVVSLVLAATSLADAAMTRTGTPSAKFTATGPAGLSIVGKTSELDVSETGGKITVQVPLGKLKTGIDLRDEHMRDKYLEVANHPNAELVVERSALTLPASGASSSGDVDGTMSLHGKSKAVRVHYTVKHDGATYTVKGSTHLDMHDFGIQVPSYLGVTVKPGVDVEVAFDAEDK